VDRARSLSGLCIATGSWLKCADTLVDDRVDWPPVRVGLRSMIVVPLSHRGVRRGAQGLFQRARPFSDGDAAVLGLLPRGGHHHVLGHPLRRERPVPPRHP
jgi:hypothetical protein